MSSPSVMLLRPQSRRSDLGVMGLGGEMGSAGPLGAEYYPLEDEDKFWRILVAGRFEEGMAALKEDARMHKAQKARMLEKLAVGWTITWSSNMPTDFFKNGG